MSAQRQREEALFAGAMQLPTEQRQAYVQAACGQDGKMCERVLALLRAEEKSGGILDQPPPELPPTQVVPTISPATEKPGDTIGPYKLLQQVGEGGCGVVYMAEQDKPVRRRVALKVIKLGMDTRQVIARFEAERQALALMDHPNIAKVLDAGSTDTGRPYFVMELVRGIKITEYCDQNNLSTQQRLQLFVQICGAVQHAHQKGIIHRDIKPSNILVTMHDGVPVPKVIDFGIAKATNDQRLTDKTLFTALEQFIGTPAYMSPEQAEMSGLDIDTRSDIYSLGVLLYELLTGRPPFDPTTFLKAGLDEIRRIIREEEPARPSTRLSTLANAELMTVARQRQSDIPKLIHLVRGDLDWIVMKCLEKDRTRRYETSNGLAGDIQRHLNNEPVLARPPSKIYRFQKSLRRNKLVYSAASVAISALVIGLGISTWMFFREKKEHRRAVAAERDQAALRGKAETNEKKAQAEATKSQQVATFLQEMLTGVDPAVARGKDTALLLEILKNTERRLSRDLKGQPAVEAELRFTIGRVYMVALANTEAEAELFEALSLWRSLPGHEAQIADVLNQLSIPVRGRCKFDEAKTYLLEALAIERKLYGNEHPTVAATINLLAGLAYRQGKGEEAEALYRQAIDMRRKLLGNESEEVASSLATLGLTLSTHFEDTGATYPLKPVEAEAILNEALGIYTKLHGTNHPGRGFCLAVLGANLELQNRLPEAESAYRESYIIHTNLHLPWARVLLPWLEKGPFDEEGRRIIGPGAPWISKPK